MINRNASLADVRRVNAEFRAKDDSHLWPICGRFSVAERAIRRAQKFARSNGPWTSADDYAAYLEGQASDIVNGIDR